MLNYYQHPHRSMSNLNPLEVHHGVNTPDIFLKQYSNERQVKKENSMLVIQFKSIELGIFLKRGVACGLLNVLKCQKS